jgi:hypothetical protein
MIIKEEFADIATPTGLMRLHLFRPAVAGRYPGILLYSEIYQITGPIRRMAAFLAGQGYVTGAPEVYHEYEPLGTVLAYDVPGTASWPAMRTAFPSSGGAIRKPRPAPATPFSPAILIYGRTARAGSCVTSRPPPRCSRGC